MIVAGRLDVGDLDRLIDESGLAREFAEPAPARRPADVSAIVEFFEVPTGDAFDVAPEKAIGFFKAKGLEPTFSYADMLKTEHDHAFTVAKMMDVDMLGQVRASLDSALANGVPFKEWQKSIVPILQSGGWWGKKTVIDPLTSRPVLAQLGSPWRLETIFRTNMQAAYAAGQWGEIVDQAAVAPLLMYDAIDDSRTRPLHASWDRKVLPVTSKWWATHYPPNGYNCRCGVIQLDAEEAADLGLVVSKTPPNDGSYLWTNPRTGYAIEVPKGLDPGFDKNVGVSYGQTLSKVLDEKIENLPTDMKLAARAAAKADAEADALIASIAAEESAAAIKARATLERMKAVTAKQAAETDAAEQLDAINKTPTSEKGASYKIKALDTLSKGTSWPELTSTEKLAEVEALAAKLKAKADLAKLVSLYKTKAVEGKVPPPGAVKAFESLGEPEKLALLQKIDAEKALIAAQKAAQEAAEAKAAAEAAAALAPPSAPAAAPSVVSVVGAPPNPATLTKIGDQRGSNPGGTYLDTETGAQWYIKQPASAEIARNEVLTGKLYEAAGIDVPEMHLVTLNGVPSIASRIVDGLTKGTAQTLAKAPGAADGFAVDAWLANWDVIGLGFDNLLLKGGRAFRVDTGAGLRFRAQGSLKGAAWGDDVLELDSLRSPTPNRQAYEVFGRLTEDQIEDSAVRVLKITPAQIRATVEAFGPATATDREALIARLVKRQEFIAAKYPAAARRARGDAQAAAGPAAPVARVTETEQRAIEASRVNGYAIATDGDQIEDHMVTLSTLKTAAGADATRGYFKLTEAGAKSLAQKVGPVGKWAVANPTVDASKVRDAILNAIISINSRANKGALLDAKCVERISEVKNQIALFNAAVDKAIAQAADPSELAARRVLLNEWASAIAARMDAAKAGQKATKIPGQFPSVTIPGELKYSIKVKPKTEPEPAGLKWRKTSLDYDFKVASMKNSNAIETGEVETVRLSVAFETDLPGGGRVRFIPADPSNPFALQGIVQIDVPGIGASSTTSILDTIEELGVESVRASEIDRQHLYLNAFASLRLAGDSLGRNGYREITELGAEGVAKKLAFFKANYSIDVAKSRGWSDLDGQRQAFGHGRTYLTRPDIDAADLERLNATHVVYHNPQGLDIDAGAGVFERVKMVLQGGGTFASLTDRMRRGVPLKGSSVTRDLYSGGGDYHFTRIRSRASQAGNTGVYWKANVLQRMDAISYESDEFGKVRDDHAFMNRRGKDIASFKSLARGRSNETVFKVGLSAFDGLDKIVLSNQAEVNSALAWMKANNYPTWPDGRALDEVIITKDKHRANP